MQLHELTPSQISFHQAKKERAARIAAKAYEAKLDAVAVEMAKPDDVSPGATTGPSDAWVARQIAIRGWFSAAHKYGDRPIKHRTQGADCILCPRIGTIQRAVAKHYNIHVVEMLSNRRTKEIVRPRQLAMYLAKVMTLQSLPEIGRRFGGMDHTTVLHAVRRVNKRLATEPEFAAVEEQLRIELTPELSA